MQLPRIACRPPEESPVQPPHSPCPLARGGLSERKRSLRYLSKLSNEKKKKIQWKWRRMENKTHTLRKLRLREYKLSQDLWKVHRFWIVFPSIFPREYERHFFNSPVCSATSAVRSAASVLDRCRRATEAPSSNMGWTNAQSAPPMAVWTWRQRNNGDMIMIRIKRKGRDSSILLNYQGEVLSFCSKSNIAKLITNNRKKTRNPELTKQEIIKMHHLNIHGKSKITHLRTAFNTYPKQQRKKKEKDAPPKHTK